MPRRTVVTLICVNRRHVLVHKSLFLPPLLMGGKGRWLLNHLCQTIGLPLGVLDHGNLKFLGHAHHFFGDEAKDISPGQATLCLYGINVSHLPTNDDYIPVPLDDERLPDPIRQAANTLVSRQMTTGNPLMNGLARIFSER